MKRLLTAVSVSLLMLAMPVVGPLARLRRPQDVLSMLRLLIFPWLLVTRSTVQLISL